MAVENPLFVAGDLTVLLGGKTVTDDEAAAAEKIVWGWVVDATGLTDRPDPTPPGLFSAAAELGAMVAKGRLGLANKTDGPFEESYDVERAGVILDGLHHSANDGATPIRSHGTFPPPMCWPEGFWK